MFNVFGADSMESLPKQRIERPNSCNMLTLNIEQEYYRASSLST